METETQFSEQDRVHMLGTPQMQGTVTYADEWYCGVEWDHGPHTQEPHGKLQLVEEQPT